MGIDFGQLIVGSITLVILVRWFIGLFRPSKKSTTHWRGSSFQGKENRGGTPSEIRNRK